LDIFAAWNIALCGGEDQRTHAEADIIAALHYLRRSDWGSL
jgi:hypothetical protein